MRSATVLMGGRSSRMGIDKAKLIFRAKPMFQWIIEAMTKVADEIIISVSEKSQVPNLDFFEKDVKVALDEEPELGPIGGLLSGLRMAGGEYVAVAPLDTPLIKPELYNLLFERAKGHDGAVPKIDAYWEPLHSVYRKSTMVPAIEKALGRNVLHIRGTYEELDIVEVGRAGIEAIDPKLTSFLNINTREDMERLSCH